MGRVLAVSIGPEHALNTTAVRHLRNECGASIPDEASAEFPAIERLLESIAVVRQFYNSIAIQQDLATLSRLLVYTGVTALVTVVVVSLMYRTHSVTVPVTVLLIVVSVGLGAVTAPLALFVAYVAGQPPSPDRPSPSVRLSHPGAGDGRADGPSEEPSPQSGSRAPANAETLGSRPTVSTTTSPGSARQHPSASRRGRPRGGRPRTAESRARRPI